MHGASQTKHSLNTYYSGMGGYRWGGTIAADQTDIFGEDVSVDDSGSYGLMLNVPLAAGFQRHLPKVLVLVFALWVVWSVFTVATGMHFGG